MTTGDWIFTAIGWLLIAAGAWMTARALFGDRSRGRRRCPRCWYDMQGVPGVTCPECGHASAGERALSRTRRRWRRAAAGLILAGSSYGAFVGPGVAERGLRAAIPGTALVCWPLDLQDWTNPWVLPATGGRWATVLREELESRLQERRLADWQVSVLLGRTRRRCEAQGEYGVTEGQRATLDTLMRAPGLEMSDAWALEVLERRLPSLGLEFTVEQREWPNLGPFEAEGPSLAASLDKVAGSMRGEWIAGAGRVRLVARESWDEPHPENSRVAIYAVGDLAPVRVVWTRHRCDSLCPAPCAANGRIQRVVDRARIDRLAEIVTGFVSPEQWMESGGAGGAVRIVGKSLLIRATPAMHLGVERLLEMLRRGVLGGPGAAAGEALGETHYTRAYNVSDLVVEDRGAPDDERGALPAQRAKSLVASLCAEVEPEGWLVNGGSDAAGLWFEPLLVVKAPAATHAAIEAFLVSRRSAPAR